MARKVQSSNPDEATTVVNIADFQRTRDSVIVALATLQSSVQDLSRAYINHANTVLNPGRGGALDSNLTNILTESGLIGGGGRLNPQDLVTTEEPIPEGKKKRKRAAHDPNAPKRALTPYFLYMQSARALIANELGSHAKPKEVADEGTRRWSEMSAEEKSGWDEKYQKNLAIYRVRMAAYKAGQPVPSEDDARDLVEAGAAPAIVAEIEAEVPTEDEEEVESSPEPVKEPTPPKSNKRRKVEKAPSPPKETPKPAAKSPEKEKKAKKSKKEKEVSPPPPPPAPPASTSKASEKKKKSKKAA